MRSVETIDPAAAFTHLRAMAYALPPRLRGALRWIHRHGPINASRGRFFHGGLTLSQHTIDELVAYGLIIVVRCGKAERVVRIHPTIQGRVYGAVLAWQEKRRRP